MRTILIRLAELLITSASLSAVSNLIHISNLYEPTEFSLSIVLLFAFIIFVTTNVFRLRVCYSVIHNRSRYLIYNFAAYFIFIIISIFVHLIFGDAAYAWMFNIFKVPHFCALGWSTAASAVVSHIAMLAAIILAPAGMWWIFIYDQEG